MTTNNAVNTSLSGQTGTGNFVGSTSPVITTPEIITSILDANVNVILGLNPVGSSVNYVVLQNSAASGSPGLGVAGSDTNIVLSINGRGTGGATIEGTKAGGNASAGYLGEFISSQVLAASGATFTSGVVADVTSISLTSGDWDLQGNINYTGTTVNQGVGWISTSSATGPDGSLVTQIIPLATSVVLAFTVPFVRINISTTTTIYLSGLVNGTGTLKASGGIFARRAR